MEIDFFCQNLIQEDACLGGKVRTASLIELFFITKHFHIISSSGIKRSSEQSFRVTAEFSKGLPTATESQHMRSRLCT